MTIGASLDAVFIHVVVAIRASGVGGLFEVQYAVTAVHVAIGTGLRL